MLAMLTMLANFGTDFNTPINVTLTSLTATSVSISWIQPPYSLLMDVYKVELRGETSRGIGELCAETQDYEFMEVTGPTAGFTDLMAFSVYTITITVISLSDGFTPTLRLTHSEFTTMEAGMAKHYTEYWESSFVLCRRVILLMSYRVNQIIIYIYTWIQAI